VSQKGSHVKFARFLGEHTDTAVVPRKHEVPVGTLRSILNQAHIDPESWGKL
jgi:predicted RNA binding protein YcfA (HicA-like mRNA interferase family)